VRQKYSAATEDPKWEGGVGARLHQAWSRPGLQLLILSTHGLSS